MTLRLRFRTDRSDATTGQHHRQTIQQRETLSKYQNKINMKVFLHYEDNIETELWKSLKITLPKSWKIGPASKLLGQFVESYNANETLGGGPNPLDIDSLHLAIRRPVSADDLARNDPTATSADTKMEPLPSDAIVVECIPDRADVYVMHGPSKTLQEVKEQQRLEEVTKQKNNQSTMKNTASCTRFGCQQRFPKGGPYPITPCKYHKSPPVFHETAKFWSCCPTKKAYDWEDFQNIPGCCEAPTCTELKDSTNQPLFLGGTDLREKAGEAVKLKSIDDFNKAQAAGGSDAAPVLERLQLVLAELGIEKELYNQVIDGYMNRFQSQTSNEVELLAAIKTEIGNAIKGSLKAAVVEQLRIN
jgi:CHORD